MRWCAALDRTHPETPNSPSRGGHFIYDRNGRFHYDLIQFGLGVFQERLGVFWRCGVQPQIALTLYIYDFGAYRSTIFVFVMF